MLKFKIEEKEYKVKDYISIEDYVKIYKTKDLFEEKYFAAKLISTVTDASLNDLLECEFENILFVANYIMNMIPSDKPKFYDRFEIDGIHYGFFPNWRDLSFAEFADMDTISTKKSDELLDLLHILAAIMYRPITKELSEHNFQIEPYDVDKMKERAELFKKRLDIKYVLGAQFFFIKFAEKCSNLSLEFSIPKFSIWSQIKLIWIMWRIALKTRSKKSMVGSQSLTELRKMILQNTMLYIRKN